MPRCDQPRRQRRACPATIWCWTASCTNTGDSAAARTVAWAHTWRGWSSDRGHANGSAHTRSSSSPPATTRDHLALGDVHAAGAAAADYASIDRNGELMTVNTAKPSVFDAGLPTLELRRHRHSAGDLSAVPGRRSRMRRSRWAPSDPRCSRTNWRGPCCATRGSSFRRHPPVCARHHVGSVVGQGDPQHPEHGG